MLGWLFYLGLARSQWFTGDDWEILVGTRRAWPWTAEYLKPHNEHWSTAPILLFRAMEWGFGLGNHLPFLLPVITAHVGLAHVLWRLLLRVGSAQPIALAGSSLFLFLPAGHENVLWAFQIGFVGALLLCLVAVLLVDHEGPWNRRDSAAAVLLVLALPFTSLPVAMAAVAAIVQAVRRSMRAAAALVLPAAVVFTAWWIPYHVDSFYAARDAGQFANVAPGFVRDGLAAAFERTLVYKGRHIGGLGIVLTVALLAVLARHVRDVRVRALAAYACAGGAVLLLLLTGYGRAQLGPAQAAELRYVYVTVALLLPAVCLAATWLARGRRRGVWFAAALLFALALEGVVVTYEAARREAAHEDDARRVLAAADDVVATQAVDPAARPEPLRNPNVTADDLAHWRAEDGFLEDVAYTPAHRAVAETNLLVEFAGHPRPGARVVDAPCTSGSNIRLAPRSAPTSHRLDARALARLGVRLRHTGGGAGAAAPMREVEVQPGGVYLTVVAPDRELEVTLLSGGPVTVCG